MRAVAFLPVVLAGCAGGRATPVVAGAAAEAASVAVFHRDAFDLVYSLLTGRDCSVVRLDAGQSWCKPPEPPPAPPTFCTRTLGLPECFASPEALPDHPNPLGDQPSLTAAQERDRTARWPNL